MRASIEVGFQIIKQHVNFKLKYLYHKIFLVCSHCVKYTLLDLLTHWHGKTSRINLLLDCCSSVDGFEGDTKTFCSEMQEVGVTVLNSSDAIL